MSMVEETQRLMCLFGLSPKGMWHPDISDGMEAVPWFFAGGMLLGPDPSSRPTRLATGSTLGSSRAAARSSDYQYTHRMSRSRAKPYDKTTAKTAVDEAPPVPMEVEPARNEAYPICA